MNKKSLMIAVVAALVCVGGVAAYQYFMGGGAKSKFSSACAQPGCGWTGNHTVRQGDTYPPTCPKCGKPGVFPVSTCRKCGNTQILNERMVASNIPGTEKLSPNTSCARCGGPIVHGD